MKKLLFILFLLVPFAANGQDTLKVGPPPMRFKHEIRLGIGDMGFEKMSSYNAPGKSNYRYAGHYFAEYQYSIKKWLGVGMKADYSNVSWHNTLTDAEDHFFNLCLIPTVRFTYFQTNWVRMYSGLGYGLLINGGSEIDFKGRKTACAAALDLTLYGISVNYDRWFAAFEIGGLNSVVRKSEIYLLGSRLLSVSIGVRL